MNLTLSQYQKLAHGSAQYPKDIEKPWLYSILGISGESGELAEQFKKMVRNDNGVMTKERREAILKEMGDVLWYVAELATVLHVDLEDVARMNLVKLAQRVQNQTIKGENREIGSTNDLSDASWQ